MSPSIVPRGLHEFSIGVNPCTGNAYTLTESEAKDALAGRIAENHHSVSILASLRQELADLAETGFDQEELEATLSSFTGTEPWRIGETFAECWLEDNRDCYFPWSTQHDIRSLKASLPGTDLVGLTTKLGGVCFAFGEVKTSSCTNTPPSVVYGNKGLTYQIRDLQSSKQQRRQLIQNLGFRAMNTDWLDQYRQAVTFHLRGRYCYWGMLLRDTTPDQRDLEHTVSSLTKCTSNDAPAEFIALYLELKIANWPSYCQVGSAS